MRARQGLDGAHVMATKSMIGDGKLYNLLCGVHLCRVRSLSMFVHRLGVTSVGAASGTVWNADNFRGGSSMIGGGGVSGLSGTCRECTTLPVTTRQTSFRNSSTDLARENASSGESIAGSRLVEAILLSDSRRDARTALRDIRVLSLRLGSVALV